MKKQIIFLLALCFGAYGGGGTAVAQERPFVVGTFQEIISQGQGHPLIINFWSYDCPPCLVEMPVFDRFIRENPDVSLNLISTDPWDQMKRIRRSLDKYGPQLFQSWVFSDPFVEKIRFSVDRKWRGQLPRTYLVGRDGAIRMINGTISDDDLYQWYKGQGK